MWSLQVQGALPVILLLACVCGTGIMIGIWLAVGWWALGERKAEREPVSMHNAEQLAAMARAADWEHMAQAAHEPERDGHTVVLRKTRGRHSRPARARVRSEEIPAAQNDTRPAPWDGAERVRPH